MVFYADYREKFGHEEVDYWWKCEKRQSQLNQLTCSTSRPYIEKLFDKAEKKNRVLTTFKSNRRYTF